MTKNWSSKWDILKINYRTILSFKNKVCRWWKQWLHNSQSDNFHDKTPFPGAQNQLRNTHLLQNRYQTVILKQAIFPIRTTKKLIFEKTNLPCQKKRKWSCRTIVTLTHTFEDDWTRVLLLCIKVDFAIRFTVFCEVKILVYDSFRFGTKNIQRLLFFCCGNLRSRLG